MCFKRLQSVRSALCFIALGIAVLLAASAVAQSSGAGDGLIQAGAEYDYPPFCIVHEDGAVDGFSVELMRAALREMGREVTFRPGQWAEIKGMLERGELDALPLVGRTPEREDIFDFTIPYLTLTGALVVRRGTTDIRGLEDLAGRQVAVMKGDNTEEFLRREERDFEIATTATFTEALSRLSEGQYDAVLAPRLVALRLIHQGGWENLSIAGRPVQEFTQDFCFAVQEGDRETLASLNEGLAVVMANGTYRHLHAKWFAALQLPTDRPIIVGGDHNYPPFEYLDENGEPAGFNVDLIRAAARAVGMDIEIRLGPWSDIRRELEAGKIDVIQGMLYSEERDRTFDFSQPYTVTHYVAVTREGNGRPPSDVAGLRGKAIVVQRGDIMHEFAVQHGLEAQTVALEAQEDALRELAAGKHDVALVARRTALYWIEERGWSNLVVGEKALLSPEYCFAVPAGKHALLAQLSEGLTILENKGEYWRIYHKWLGVFEEEPTSLLTALRYSALVLVPLLVVLLLALAWSWSLRKQVAERTEELRGREEYLRSMIAYSPLALFSTCPDGRVQTWNPSAERLFGWTAQEAVGKMLPIVPEEKMSEFAELRRRVLEEGGFVGEEVTRRKKSGESFVGSLSAGPIRDDEGNTVGIMAAMLDITERKTMEEQLRETARRLSIALEAAEIGIWDRDLQTNEVHYSPEWKAQLGYEEDEFPDEHDAWLNRIHPEDLPRVRSVIHTAIVDETADYDVSYRLRHKDGSYRWVSAWGEVLRTDEGRPIRIVGCHLDITGVVRAREEIEALSRFPEEDPNPVLRASCDGALEYANPPAMDVCSKMGLGIGDTLPAEWAGHGRNAFFSAEIADVEVSIEGRHYLLTFAPVCAKGYVNIYGRDVTERRQLETQLRQKQKLEAIGSLAGGVAHDFNNILTGIQGFTKLALNALPDDSPVRRDLEESLQLSERAADLTRQLLAFSRRQTLQPVVMNMNTLVDDMSKMIGRLIGEDIDLVFQPGPDLGMVKVDPGQVEQVLMNLAVNARDAMPAGGKMTIETGNVLLDSEYAETHEGVTPGEHVMLAVSDTGCGMDAETRERIFDPFFTTKELGQGTGLGLATVYGIVKQHDGHIWVYSEPGGGTTFKIYLPRVRDELEPGRSKAEETQFTAGSEVILVVEDEQMVRRVVKRYLENHGYEVLVTGDAEEAEEVLASRGNDLDLVLADVVLPGRTGREFYEDAVRRYPDLKVLYMSGYTDNSIVHHGVLDEGTPFLQKPFTERALCRKVREVLDA